MRLSLTTLSLLAVLLASSHCSPKRAPMSVSGTDEEQLDQIGSRLEELRSRSASNELACPEVCPASEETCTLSSQLCGLSERMADRTDLPPRCAQSQEQCAQLRDDCARCR